MSSGRGCEKKMQEMGTELEFVKASPAMCRIADQVGQLAKVDVPVLCLGESGTGKEVVARLIHQLSPRANQMFLKVNCAALPADLLESELFGYESGAFTGAVRSKPGKFEICHRGTILLDEVGEMPPSLQAKLLHVLQDGEFTRLGGRHPVRVDVRVLAATNVDVHLAMRTKMLREDLYYRLSGFVINLPPLRERVEDIPVLLSHYLARFAVRYSVPPIELSPSFLDACMRYSWPGNVRELENVAKRFLILRDESLALSDLAPSTHGASHRAPAAGPAEVRTDDLKTMVRGLKQEAEVEAIRRALEETHWNRKEAAGLLKISYKALLYKVRQYGLDRTPSDSRRNSEAAKGLSLKRAVNG